MKEKASEILALGSAVESRVSELYRRFYKRFKDDDLAREIWHTLSVEEAAHADFFKAQKGLLDAVPEAFGAPRVEPSTLEDGLKMLDGMHSSVEAGEVDLETALNMANKIEDGILGAEHTELVEITSEGLKNILESLFYDSKVRRRLILKLAEKNGTELSGTDLP